MTEAKKDKKIIDYEGRAPLETWQFISWTDTGSNGETATATALAKKVNGRYHFDTTINVCQNGDLGKKGEEGVYERIWHTDWANDREVNKQNVRPSTAHEAYLWIRHCLNDDIMSLCFSKSLKTLHIEDGNSYAVFKTNS